MDTASFFKNRKKIQRDLEQTSSDYSEYNINHQIKLENDVQIKVERIEFEDSRDCNFKTQIVEEEFIMKPDILKVENARIAENSKVENAVKVEKINKCKQTSQTIYNCLQCTETFCSNQARSKHYKEKHNSASLSCKYCLKTFSKLANLNRHFNYFCQYNDQKEKNNNEKKYGMFKNPFICDICKKSFTHKNSLRIHIENHLGVKDSYKCRICNKSYTKKHNLKSHIKSTHSNTYLYYCKVCLKGFNWRYALVSHEKTYHRKK